MKSNTSFAVLVLAGLAAVMTPAFLLAAGGTGQGFDAIVHGIEERYHVHATRIPFMSLVSGIAGVATHGGVRGLHVAEFDHFRADTDVPVDGAEFNALIEKHVGPGWERIVRETSRNGGDQSFIYVRPEGEHMGMLVVDLDSHELNVVQMSINPDQLTKELSDHHNKVHQDEPDADTSEDKADEGESD